mmetsp:Transcript_53928/g.169616  ORF Transcript_53928/g.169616 Transcript_53928/m.169616 type:complete len:244 (-) Transcript_53928:16-747(-)
MPSPLMSTSRTLQRRCCRDCVVETALLGDARLIVEEGVDADAAADGPASVDLLHHRRGAANEAAVADDDIRRLAEASATAAGGRAVHGRASPRGVLAEAVDVLRGPGQVGVSGLIAAARAGLRDRMEPPIDAVNGAAMIAANVPAVRDMQRVEPDVDGVGPVRYLCAVAEGHDRAVRPARAAMRNLPAEADSAVIHAVLVARAEAVRVPGSARIHPGQLRNTTQVVRTRCHVMLPALRRPPAP